MKSKRKSTKPITMLTKIEALLSDVLDELSSIERSVEKNVRGLLLSAAASIAKAKDFVAPALVSEAPRKSARGPRKTARTRRRPTRRIRRARGTR